MLANEILVGIIGTLILAVLSAAIRYRKYLGIAINCYLFSRNKKIRVSMAAMLVIRRENKFLLIRNHHRPELFGPIGGVFKYYASAVERLDHCGFTPQNRDQDMNKDLRGYLIGKKLPGFLEWFFSGKNREVESLSREIREELQEIKYEIGLDNITGLQFDLVKSIIEGLDKVPGVDYLQLRYFDVYRLCRDDPKCDNLTEKLFEQLGKNPDAIAVTANGIFRRRSFSGEVISGHAGYLISDSKIGEAPPIP